ncbi:MAG: 4Fe-4S dicluster domain-containing protein [Thermodesulfobacteriota bacterium]
MAQTAVKVGSKVVIAPQHLQQLFQSLQSRGYLLVGPTLDQGNLVYAELTSVADLPRGFRDEQQGGSFRFKRQGNGALFGYGVGQQSWKKFLFPSDWPLWQARRTQDGWQVVPSQEEVPRFAFMGVHSCDLHALAVQDRVFIHGQYADPTYQARREGAFIVAVNCTQAGGTCFCASLGTGPKAASGFDLCLTEVLQDDQHYLVAEVGTVRGGEILAGVSCREARGQEVAAAESLVAGAARRQSRSLDPRGLKELLYRNYDSPRWDEVAARCLTCGNCTMVCPTCFCHTIKDLTDLNGEIAERRRYWEVCFTLDFSYIHGGSIRVSPQSRYRQWLTHKLATWVDQFGCLGCIGCGRCITWCPVAIDITAEVQAIRESEANLGQGE